MMLTIHDLQNYINVLDILMLLHSILFYLFPMEIEQITIPFISFALTLLLYFYIYKSNLFSYNNIIATINNLPSLMNTSSSQWQQDLSLSYWVDNDQTCRKLIKIFEEGHIEHFGLEVSFSQEYQLQQFQKEWTMQIDDTNSVEYKGLKGVTKYYLKRPQDCPYESIMDLGGEPIRGEIFMEVFKPELDQMKQEYQIKFSTKGQRLYIFMRNKESLNIICKNRLTAMNNSLYVFFGHEPNLIFLLNVSYQLRKQLLERGVNVWFKKIQGSFLAVFFSTQFMQSATSPISQMLAIIQQITQFDVSVFNVHHKSISQPQAMSVKQVVRQALKEDIAILQTEYEINLQFSEDNYYIVFHTKHSTFGEQPVSVFQQRMNNLVILSVKSNNIKQFDNKIRKFIKESPFATQIMNKKRNQTYIAIDLGKIHAKNTHKDIKKQVDQFLKFFVLLIEPRLELKIYMNHMAGDIQKFMKRIISISEQHKLIIQNHEFYDLTQKKAILKLKDLSESVLAKRQKQLLFFLDALIALPQSEASEQSAVSFLNQATLGSIGNMTNSSKILNSSRLDDSIIDEVFQIPWLGLQFSAPKCVDLDEGRHYRQGRRNRPIEDLLSAQSDFKFKVWNLQISSALRIPIDNINTKPYLFRTMFKDGQLNEGYQLATLASFKPNQEGTIGFFTNYIQIPVIPLIIFKRIQ